MSEKLKNCPFCGESQEIKESGAVYGEYFITCCFGTVGESNKGNLIRSWNTRHESKWIPVSERLPENNSPLLLITVNQPPYKYVIIGQYYDDTWFTDPNADTEIEDQFCKVIAWMELPAKFEV